MRGSMENERIAEKLRDPDAYYQKWKKSPKVGLENQLNKSIREKNYWMVSCGFLLYLLIILIIVIINWIEKRINYNIFIYLILAWDK